MKKIRVLALFVFIAVLAMFSVSVSATGGVRGNLTPPVSGMAGDINGDGIVNNDDVITLFRYHAKWKDIVVDELALDVNGDGIKNNDDVIHLFRYNAKWDVAPPVYGCAHEETTDLPAEPANCLTGENGLTAGVQCTKCGNIISGREEIIAAHTLEDVEEVPATCEVDGWTAGKQCTVCHTYTEGHEKINALGHDPIVIEAVAPKCTETGLTEGLKCNRCGEILTEQTIVDALGHTEETIPAVAATCENTGLTAGTKCSVCNETLVPQETTGALGHTAETIAEIPATCRDGGWTAGEKCSVCSKVLTPPEEIPSTGNHTYEPYGAVEATSCTEASYTAGSKCSVCGDIEYEPTFVEAHHLVEPTILPAEDGKNCKTPGKTEGKVCGACGEILVEQEDVPSDKHQWPTIIVNCEDVPLCELCGLPGTARTHEYAENEQKRTSPTCTEPGYKLFECTECEASYKTESAPATGHKPSTAPEHFVSEELIEGKTCEYRQFVRCSECYKPNAAENVVVEAEHPMIRHEYVGTIKEGEAATCTVGGKVTYTCKHEACETEHPATYTYTKDVDPDPEAHLWKQAETDSDPNDGYTDYVCEHNPEEHTKKVKSVTSGGAVDVTDLENANIQLTKDGDGDSQENVAEFSLDKKVLENVSGKLILGAEKYEVGEQEGILSPTQIDLLKGNPVYDFTLKQNGSDQNIDFNGGTVTVTLPYEPAEGEDINNIAIYYLKKGENGEEDTIESYPASFYRDANGNGFVTFTATHFSHYAVAKLTPREACMLYGRHEFHEVTVTYSCTLGGRKFEVCSNCAFINPDPTKTEPIPPKEHDYQLIGEESHATCTTEGAANYKCKECGVSYTETLPKIPHSYILNAEAEGNVAPTCCAEGVAVYTCEYSCGATNQQILPKTVVHSYVLDKSKTTTATCTINGVEYYVCSVEGCGASYSKVTAKATGHKASAEWTKDEASHWQACENGCGEKLNLTAHGFNSLKETVSATCTERGYETWACACGETQKTTLDILDHVYTYDVESGHARWTWSTADGDVTATLTYICKRCQRESEPTEAVITSEVKAHACTENGVRTYTATVDHYTAQKSEPIPATGHKASADWSKDEKHHWRTCENGCDAQLTKNAHAFNQLIETVPATCVDTGYETWSCTCGATETRTIDALGHVFVYDVANGYAKWTWNTTENGDMTATLTYVCKRCHTESEPTEAVVTVDVTEPTCTVDGVRVYTATVANDGGESYTAQKNVSIPAIGHDYIYDLESGKAFWIWTADEASGAIQARLVFICQNETEAEDHRYELTATVTSEITKPSTCTHEGERTYTASVTEGDMAYTDSLIQPVEVNASAHSFGAWQLVTAPTFEKTGTLVKTCVHDAAHTKSHMIAKLPETDALTKGYTFEALETVGRYTYTADGDMFDFDVVTVTYTDYDGTVLKTETVVKGGTVTAPAQEPIRDGYFFRGWSDNAENVQEHITITAVYEADPTPTFIAEHVSAVAGDQKVAVTIRLRQNPGFQTMGLTVHFDSNVMTIDSASKGIYAKEMGMSFVNGNPTAETPDQCNYMWYNSANPSEPDADGGVIVTIYFNIAEDADAGTYDIVLAAFDGSENALVSNGPVVECRMVAGSITIS